MTDKRIQGDVTKMLHPLVEYKAFSKNVSCWMEHIAIIVAISYLVYLYRQPRVAGSGVLSELDQVLTRTSRYVVLIGDFNARHASWDKRTKQCGRTVKEWCKARKLLAAALLLSLSTKAKDGAKLIWCCKL